MHLLTSYPPFILPFLVTKDPLTLTCLQTTYIDLLTLNPKPTSITYVLPIYMHLLNYESPIILPTYLPTGPRSHMTYHIGYQGET